MVLPESGGAAAPSAPLARTPMRTPMWKYNAPTGRQFLADISTGAGIGLGEHAGNVYVRFSSVTVAF